MAQSPPTLPQNWAGAGGAYDPTSRPQVAGWTSYATLVSEKAGLYSFTTHDITSTKNHPYTIQTSVRTGIAVVLRTIGPLVILGLGDGGMAGSGDTVGGAFSGGGVGILRLGKTTWTLVTAVRHLKTATGGSQNTYQMGVGKTF